MSISPLNIAVGTYDGIVAGLSLESDSVDTSLTLQTHFASDVHASAVRASAFRGSDLVTGGADEVIRVFDVSRRVEVGTLLHHEGTITSLNFISDHGRHLLFSGADDAAICIWRTSDWHLLKRLTGHQAGIVDVAVHPSAAVALSVSKDRALFMWNLSRGKIAFSVKTKGNSAPSAIRWAPDGQSYALCSGSLITLSDISGQNINTFSHTHPIGCAQFVDQNTLATGGDDMTVTLWDSRLPQKGQASSSNSSKSPTVAFSHSARVCGISVVDHLVLAADSMGGLKIWDSRTGGKPRIETDMSTNGRITCMTASPQEWRESLSVTEADLDQDSAETPSKKLSSADKTLKSKRNSEQSKPLEGTASQRKRKKRKLQQKK